MATGELKIVASQEFDRWGHREGPPVVVAWQQSSRLPGSSLWVFAIAAIALFAVYRFFRRRGSTAGRVEMP